MKFTSFEELLIRNAREYSDKTAFVFDADGVKCTLTHAQLYEEILRRKQDFLSVAAGCVGVLQAPSIKWLIDMFAAVIAGKQTVLLDPMCEPSTLAKLISATDVGYLCTDALTAPLANVVPLCPADAVKTSDTEGNILFFTSGTTATGKAVVLTSRSLCASAWNGQQKLPCTQADNVLCMLPLTHVFGFVCAMLWPLSQGATVSLGRGLRNMMFDCSYFEPTIISVVPSILKFLIGANALNQNLKTILVGAGPASTDVLDAAKARGYEIRFGYGLTETSSGVAISCGDNPFAMTICSDANISLAEDGEILIRCPECMMQGYYKDDASTQEVLQDGILCSGDIGKFDEQGHIYIVGRKKDILVLANGNKLYLPEWEDELRKAVGIEDIALALKDDCITLFVGDKDSTADKDAIEKQIAAFNREKSFDIQIGDVEIINTALPRTATGKIRRWALK